MVSSMTRMDRAVKKMEDSDEHGEIDKRRLGKHVWGNRIDRRDNASLASAVRRTASGRAPEFHGMARHRADGN